MPPTVLIIDAEEDFAAQLADVLRQEGVEPSVTGDGKIGLDLARMNVPGAIVLCVELPRMSGYSICAKLKKDADLRDVPLIITSAEATPETFEHHKKLKTRAEEYLKKPFEPGLLVDILRSYMGFGAAEGGVASDLAEELSIEDQPPATLSDDVAFSEEEAISMDSQDVAPSAEMQEIDGLLSDLTRPTSLDSARAALGQAAAVAEVEEVREPDPQVAAPVDAEPEEVGSSDELLTTVGFVAPPMSPSDELRQELEELHAELQHTKDALAKSEREKLALAHEKVSAASQLPTAASGREVVALKKELNARQREILDLEDRLHRKEKEILELRDHETDLEGQLVQLEEQRALADAAKGAADEQAAAAEAHAASADARAARADAMARESDARAHAADQRAAVADARARDADKRAGQSDAARLAAEDQAREADARAADADARAADAEQRYLELKESSEATITELDQRLGEATSRGIELDGALSVSLEQGRQLEENLADREARLGDAEAQIQSLLATSQAQAEELSRQAGELAQLSVDAEGLRGELATALETGEQLRDRVSVLEAELAAARGEAEALRGTIHELEQEREVNEGRIARAYQKIRDDEKIKGKARKAIEIALALLQEAGYAPEGELAQAPEEDVPAELPLEPLGEVEAEAAS